MRQRESIAFYVKGRPQGADIIDLVLTRKRVFIGYPPFRRGAKWDRHAVASSMLDISVPAALWQPDQVDPDWYSKHRKEISRNRNLALRIDIGSMVVVPRAAAGLCYIGRVAAPFQLENAPAWADEYLLLRRKQKLQALDEASHVGDVVQGWQVERWEAIPFPGVPRWIQYQVMGRTTLGQIHDRSDGRKNAVAVLSDLYNGHFSAGLPPTSDRSEIVARLLDWVSPAVLEHLVCDLLQRAEAPLRWWHTGGSGDGGADGVCMHPDGQVVAVLQCKWLLTEDPELLADSISRNLKAAWGVNAKVYIATLVSRMRPRSQRSDLVFLGPDEIAELLWTHRQGNSLAASLGIE